MHRTQDLHVRGTIPLISPRQLWAEMPLSERASATVFESRETIRRILSGDDKRVLAIVGPCSIHDQAAAMEYAERFQRLAKEVADRLFLVMRVYFEKPRTTIGWKGLINDPNLDGSFDIAAGLRLGRRILSEINELGVPAASEMLDPIVPQYIADLVSWSAIGARTTESQTHRELASGLSMPVGFKNGTDGSLQTAIDAMVSARAPHGFLGLDHDGHASVVQTVGNPDGHLILRGGRKGPNYAPQDMAIASEKLSHAGLPSGVMIDCSHANSNKNPAEQGRVWNESLRQRLDGNETIIGLMLESNLFPGKQNLENMTPANLKYGVSITDGCIGWEETETLIRSACRKLQSPPQLQVAASHA